jgi:hypothetical protein
MVIDQWEREKRYKNEKGVSSRLLSDVLKLGYNISDEHDHVDHLVTWGLLTGRPGY